MVPESPKETAGICSNDFGAVHGPCVPAAGLASPLSRRPANALAQLFDALARPVVGQRSKFDCRRLADGPGLRGKYDTNLDIQEARESHEWVERQVAGNE